MEKRDISLDLEVLDDQVFAAAQHVLGQAEADFETPLDALFAHVLVAAMLAKMVDLPLDELVKGVSAAYNDLTCFEEPLQ